MTSGGFLVSAVAGTIFGVLTVAVPELFWVWLALACVVGWNAENIARSLFK